MAESRAQANSPLPHTDSLVGRTIGRYRVTEFLGAGAMGEVYLADDPMLKREVALKRVAPQLRADKEYRARFLREAERASRVKSPHVAAIYDVLEEDNEIFLVMENVKGHLLRERLHGPVSVESFLKLAEQCAEAVESAHREGIVHCDIKPENIMVTDDDEVKVLDFGVAKRLPRSDQSTTMDSGQSGTPAYMAPEVLLNRPIDGRTDLFSLGIVFYEILTGRHPFAAGSLAETIDHLLKAEPASIRGVNEKVPVALEAIVLRMLKKKPDARYASATELLSDLRGLHAQKGPQTTRRISPRWRWAWIALAVLALIVVGIRYRRTRNSPLLAKPPRQLAVLAFNASGDDSGTRAFSDGLTETLTTKLTQLREDYGLLVVPSSEIRGQGVRTADQARRVFGATLVLEGSLEQSAEQVRINYTLVDAGNGQPLHAEVITENSKDPFGVEDKVVASVLNALDVQLRGLDRGGITLRGTNAPDAYDYYLRGVGYLRESQKPDNARSAIAVFQHALVRDPGYALAWAGLGQAYWQQYENTQQRDWVQKAREACKQAESLDTTLAATHICLGTIWNGTGEYERAEQEFKRATEIDPTDDDAVRELAETYQQQGKAELAEAAYLHAIRLRPQSWIAYDRLGIFYSNQARYNEAVKSFEQVIQLAPDGYQGYNNLGGTYLAQGRYEEAIPLLLRSAEVLPTSTAYSNLGAAYVYLHRYNDAVNAYEQSVKMTGAGYQECGNLAEAYYWSPGGRDKARQTYRKAIDLARDQLSVNPHDADVLSSLSLYHAMMQETEPALDYLQQALKVGDNNEILFNAAKTEYQLGRTDKALQYLKKAITGGYSKFYAKDDPVFANIREDERFRTLVEKP